MLARIPLTFALRFDAGAVYQEIEWASATLVGQAHVLRLLAAAQAAIVGHCPVQPAAEGFARTRSFAEAASRTALLASGKSGSQSR